MTQKMKFNASTAEAVALLRISEQTLRRLRRDGVLRPGVHFIANGAGKKAPTLRWAPEAVQEALAMQTKKVLP